MKQCLVYGKESSLKIGIKFADILTEYFSRPQDESD